MPQNTLHRQLNRNLNLYLSQGFLSWFIISWPIEILYFAQILESYTLAMSLFALQNLCLVFFELPLNWLADKYGRKNLCILGALSLFLGYLCYSFADGYFLLFFGPLYPMQLLLHGGLLFLLYLELFHILMLYLDIIVLLFDLSYQYSQLTLLLLLLRIDILLYVLERQPHVLCL